MDMIDGKWIKARISGKRGEQAELARALDITATQVSLVRAQGLKSNSLILSTVTEYRNKMYWFAIFSID